MKFTINKIDLYEQTHLLYNVVPSKNAMPILTNYLIKANADKNQITFCATDLELTVLVDFEAAVQESGEVTINARLFNDMMANLPNTLLYFRQEDDQLHVSYGESKFNFLIADSSQFPMIPTENYENAFDADAKLFKKMIHNTAFAVLQEGSKAVYNGIFWQSKKDVQIMASTDGTKIAEFKMLKEVGINEEKNVILPLKCLSFIEKLIKNTDDKIKIEFKANRVVFAYKNFQIYSNVLEGPYPDYTKAYPKEEQPNRLIIEKSVLKENVKRISLLASQEFLKIKMEFNSNQELKISAINRDLGDGFELLNDINYEGENLELSLNYRHFLSILDIIETDEVMIRLGSEKSPIMIYNSEEKDDYKVKFLLMPLRRRR